MRDMQSAFWDARTRRERIDQVRGEHREALKKMLAALERDALTDRDGQKINWNTPGLFVRASAIPQSPCSITPFPFDDWRLALRPSNASLGQNVASAFGEGHFGQKWSRTAHGAWALERGPAHWNFRDDGTASLVGFKPGYPGRDGQQLNFHHPGWYVAMAANVMVIADRMRRAAGRPDIPIELDVEFLHQGTAIGGDGTHSHGAMNLARCCRTFRSAPSC